MTKKKFLAIKYCLTVFLMACVIGVQAQSATYKNITGVSGKPSITGNTVSDISFTTFQFPAIGLALSASAPDLQNDGSYNITYTYTVKNMGGLDLTKVNVNSSFSSTFPSPMTYTITSVSGQGITTNSTFKGTDALPSLSNTNATLAAGATATITVVVNLKNNGQYGTFTTQPAVTAMAGTSTVSDLAVNGAVPDANGNGSAFDDESPTPVTLARPDIEVKKTANTLTPYVGNNVVFTITVTNKGTGDAANVVIAEALGNGFTYVSTSVGSAYNTTTKNWSVGILKSGQSKTMTLTAKVNMSGTYTNTASSNHPEDIVPANNSDIVTVAPLPSADVQIVKTASKDSVNVRDNVTYTLTAGNNGPSHATEVAVTDTLPAGLVPVLPLAGALTYDPATRVITWNLGNVNAGTTGLVQTFDATVSEDMGRAVFANKATITRKEYDPKASNNSSTAAVVPKQFVDLVVTKSINAPSPLYPLDKVTFTVTVQNTGSNNCYDVTVTDVLQSGYNNGTATASKGTFANNNWKITQLNKGETATLTYQVTVQPKGNYNNSATAYTTDNDINLANNTAAIVPPVVTPRMDLAVGIATSGTPQAGQPLTFTVTATNNGPSDATGVIVENLQLPAGYTLTQSTPGSGTYNSSTGVLTIGNLAAGSSTILTLIANVNPDETDYTLNAHITGNETEVTLTNNTASVTPAIKQATDLAVTKTVDFSTPDAGSNVVFTIVAKNDGPSKATNVKVVDALPAGYTFVSASSAAYTGNTWTVGTLNVNQSATLTITAKVNASGSYQNTATISGAEVDNNTSNNTASVSTTPVPVSDVKITKTLSNNAPDAGSTVTFTITATNDGPSVAQSVTVKDVLENGYTYAVNPTPSVGTFNKATGIWTIGNMAAGKTESIALIVKVLGKGTSYGNTATITTTTKDNNTTNNTATVPPATVRAVTDLQIEKTVDKATADAGTKVVFTLKATNKGASPATNVKVTDLLPSGFTFESVQPSNAAYVASSGEWAIGTLDSGEVKSIQLTAIVNATGNYTNTATITGSEYDPVTTNNTSDVTVTRVAVTDLEVLKTVDNTTPDVGATVTFTIKAINHGPSKATGVVVDDPAPSGYGNITYNPTVGTVDTDGKWTIGDLNKDAVATLTVTAKVLASGNYLNTATISGTETDRTTTNNTSSVTSVPVPVADLVVTKTISNSTPDVGNTVTFTITAKNNGPSTATGVTVTDLLKSGYLFKQKTVSSGAYNETTSVWTIGNMTIGQLETLTIEAEVLPTGDYNNSAVIASPVKDNNTGNDTATITTPQVRPIADLVIQKSVDKTTADAGSKVVFTLKATNNGPSTATNVIVNDLLPDGYTFESVAPAATAYDAATGIWTIGTMNSGASQTITVTATVNPAGNYTNTATIAGTEHDPVTTTNTSSVTVTRVAVTDLEVLKTVDNTTPDVGDTVTFTIKAINHGPSKATGVVVDDPAPIGYGNITYTPTVGTVDTDGKWTIGDLNKDAIATLTVTAKVLASGSYLNTATISGTETDRTTTNNTSSVTPVPVPVADLVVTKTISNSTPDVGNTVTFTITAKNNGPSTATGVTVTDLLKSGYLFKQKTLSSGAYNETTGVWTIGNMTIGQLETLTIEAEVLPTGDYNNSAVIASPVKDKNTGNDTATITTPQVRPIADLVIQKSVDKTTADAGSKVVFTLKATNNGPSTATNVIVNDLLPDGYTFESVAPAATAYDAATGIWTIGTMNSGASQTIAVTATVNPTGNYTNTATIAGTEHDPATTNNTSSVTVTRVAVTDLEVLKTVDNTTPDVGDTVTFTIKAINHGPSKATGVVVDDPAPTGYGNITYTPSIGTVDTDGKWTIGDLNKDDIATLTVTAKVLASGSYVNTATISGTETDRTTTNNTSSVTPVPVPVADLVVTKTISNSTPDVGNTVTFTITAKNNGPSTATGVTVTDLLKSGYLFKQKTLSSGAYNEATGIWTIGNMTIGQLETLTIEAEVLPTGDYNNSAVIASPVKDNNTGNDTATITTPLVRPIADLVIQKSVDKTTADAGSKVVFTLKATNNGPSTATNVILNDLLPDGYTFESVAPAATAYDAATGIWTIGTMNSGTNRTITVTATVNPAGNYTNTATIAGTEHDPVTTTNTSSVTVTRVAVTDLEVLKTVDNTTPDVGDTVTFTIKAINHGPSKATGVVVDDPAPTGYGNITYNPTVGTVDTDGKWTIGDLNKDASATLTVTAKVLASGSYLNTATISGTETDRTTTNNTSSVTPVPVPVADLVVTKTISNSAPDVGNTVTFTITAKNNGPSTATGVTVTDLLKSGYLFKQKTVSSGAYNESTGIWTIGNMTIGQLETLTIEAEVLPTGDYNNSAVIASPVKDKNTGNNTATITTPLVRPIADLVIQKSVDKTTADAGSKVVFTLKATNNGPSTATNVIVNDLLPDGYTFESVAPAATAYDAATGIWTIGTMNSGASQTITVTATVNPAGNYPNTATIAGTEHDPVTTNNTSSVTVTRVAVTDLEVVKTVDNTTPDVGTNVTFTIKASNHGPSTATNVVVTDVLPAGYELVQATPASGTFSKDGKWTLGTMNAQTTTTLVITAKVLATGNYTNTASIAGTETDHNTANNSSSVTPVPVAVTNLQVVKTINNSTPDVSSQVTFTITAKNEGPSAATGVTVTDILQSGYHFDEASTTTGSYDARSGKWNIGNLANGQSATLQIKATVQPEGDYSNVAVISGNEKDKVPGDNESAITAPTPVPVADLQVTKTIDKTVPGTGDKVTFTITVKNNGASKATHVRVSDQLQSGFRYLQATAGKGSYDPTTGIWTIGNMNAGETIVLQIEALVNTTGQYTNTATVSADEKDPVTTNNTSTLTVTPDAVTDLFVSKEISNMAPPHGSDVTFNIKTGNNGPSDATGVTVTDILPAGYTYKSSKASTGTYDAVTGKWTIGNLAYKATAEMTMTVTINKTGSYTNTATIAGNETDRVGSNNSSTVAPVPVPLSTRDDAASTEEPDPVVINVIKNDTYGNTGHTVYIKDLPQHGTVKDNGNGTVTYTPQAGFGGTDQFTYYIQDQSGFASNVSTVTIDVTKRLVDLSVKKVILTPPAEITVGKNVTFELSVTNNSRKGASNIVVTDILASNIGDMQIKTNVENGKESYDPATKTMSWKLDTLAPGQTIKLTLSAKLLSGGPVNNTATVTGENADPDLTNNTATVSSEAKGPDIFIPTAFTPNGDGINDKFIILGIDRYPGSVLIVFNRWGNVVYRSNDYRNNWDGSGLNEGTYYYELVCPTTSNNKISLKGWVQLVR